MSTDLAWHDCPPADWYDTLDRLERDGWTYLDFLTAVDETDRAEDPGLDVVAHLYRFDRGVDELMVRTRVPDGEPLGSVTRIWAGAAWHERETAEMFGLEFTGFTDGTGRGLRPLLLPDTFEGHPLRKSFVLTARVSKPWPGAKDPGESAPNPRKRRRLLPPGVPDASWGPR